MRKGAEFEERVVEYLLSIGYKILHRNFHCWFGEIDIVALEGETTVFVEVKGGRSLKFGDPTERFDRRKRWRLLQCIEYYLQSYPTENYRLDLIVVRRGEIEHLKGVDL